jgi:hypothetical protein
MVFKVSMLKDGPSAVDHLLILMSLVTWLKVSRMHRLKFVYFFCAPFLVYYLVLLYIWWGLLRDGALRLDHSMFYGGS